MTHLVCDIPTRRRRHDSLALYTLTEGQLDTVLDLAARGERPRVHAQDAQGAIVVRTDSGEEQCHIVDADGEIGSRAPWTRHAPTGSTGRRYVRRCAA